MDESETSRAARIAQRRLESDKRLMDAVLNATWDFEKVRETFDVVLRFLKKVQAERPPNWPAVFEVEQAISLVNAGVPVMWVPPSGVLVELVGAQDRPAQMAVLQTRSDQLHKDVSRVLAEVTSPKLTDQLFLARRSVEAWAAGHYEASQALAVAVAETVITRHYAKRRKLNGFDAVRKAAALDVDAFDWKEGVDDIEIAEMRFMLAMAPIAKFYTSWRPSWGTPPPEALSRHVSVHHAIPAHYNEDNALVAVLLQTSLLRAFQDFLEQEALKPLAGA